ncbi:MAG: SDR family NAD(P)-dependent oxidoreductase [Gammaproteobacteria bacterium]
MSSIAGRSALVTGAAQGIGRATAVRLARDGARVCARRPRGGRLQEGARGDHGHGRQRHRDRCRSRDPCRCRRHDGSGACRVRHGRDRGA